MIVAGIVLYNPQIDRLKMNIEAVINQIDYVCLVDNGSDNLDDVKAAYCLNPKIVIIENGSNLGIAKALNQIAEFAIEKGAQWVLTLDQDSIAPNNMIEEYERYTDDDKVGMICCSIRDMNFNPEQNNSHKQVSQVNTCITSGSYLRLKAWREVCGYYEPLFIDQVDFDMCYLLREYQYKIMRVGHVVLTHEVGHSRPVRLLWRNDISTNHTPVRYYYMCRNLLAVAKRHGNWRHGLSAIVRRLMVVNCYEKNKWEKNRMMAKGIMHGIINKLGRYE